MLSLATLRSCLLLLGFSTLMLNTVFAQQTNTSLPAVLNDQTRIIDLDQSLELFEDKEGNLSFEQISSAAYSSLFFKTDKPSPNFGFTDHAWWVRFTLHNEHADSLNLLIRQDYPLIDYVDFWSQQDDQWVQVKTGDRRLFMKRQVEHRDFLFPTTLQSGESKTFYLRFESSGPINISLSVYQRNQLIASLGKEQLAYGMYFGGFLVLLFYNLFIFIVVKDRAFFYYLLYVLSYGLYFAVHNGLSYQFFWPESPDWGNQSLVLLLGLTLIWGMQFSRRFLDTAQFAPRLDKIGIVLQALALLLLLGASVFSYATIILPMSLLTVVLVAVIMAMGAVSLLSGYRPARFFLLAWSALLLGVIVYMLKTFGLLPHNVLTQNGFQIGSLIEMVLLSLALASRVRELQWQSSTDPLTSLANRRVFDETLAFEFERCKRTSDSLSLLVIDIDLFKKFNDSFGHAKGDEALRMVAKRLSEFSRKMDLVCRYGGEEFAMILPNTDKSTAFHIAERIRRKIEQENPTGERVTISIGLASLSDDVFESTIDLFEAADCALYMAKAEGRNRVIDFKPQMQKKAVA